MARNTPVAISGFDAHYENGAVRLRWRVFADEPFEGFCVYRSPEAGNPVPIATLHDPTQRAFTDTGVAPGTLVRYTLSALRSDGTTNSAADSWDGDVSAPEWVAVADPGLVSRAVR